MNQKFIDFVFKFFSNLRENNIGLVYDGEVNHKVMQAFTELTSKELDMRNEANPVRKKVFNVMVESLQNISKHAECMEKKDANYRKGILLISEDDITYNITTGNVIKTNQSKPISDKIDYINSKNKEELRELFKERLSTGRISIKGGAGLGFIDIAKKSGNKLEYHFEKINDEYLFFIFNSRISKIA